MGTTKRIPPTEWKAYFDGYTRERLEDEGDVREAAAVEVMSPSFGDQFEVTRAPLMGMTYDEKSNAFELSLGEVDHMVFHPKEIAVIEEDDGFISELEVLSDDDTKEIVHLLRSGPPAYPYAPPPSPGG
jgi:hypothetical protein